MISDVINSSRVIQLRELLLVLSDAIDSNPGARDLAQLVKQYRETLKEIEDIEGEEVRGADEIGAILAKRHNNGESEPVRKNRARLPKN